MATIASWSSSADGAFFTGNVGGAPTVASGGSYGERFSFANGATTNYSTKTIASTPTDFSIRLLWSVAALPTSSFMIASAIDGTSTIQWRADFVNGFLRIRNASAAVATAASGGTLVTGTEYWLKIYRVGSTLTFSAYDLSGTLLQTISGTVGSATVNTLYLGNNAALTGTLGATTYDEIVMADSGAEPALPASPLAVPSVVVSPTSAVPPFTMTVTFTATGGTGSYSYAVTDWGDGSSTAAQGSNVMTKTFASGTTPGAKNVSWTVTG